MIYENIETIRYLPNPELFIRTLHEPFSINSILDVGTGHGGVFDQGYWTNRKMENREACDIYKVRELSHHWKVRDGVDACKLTDFYPEKSFDLVQCMECLEHIPDSRRALEQLCKVARKLVIMTSDDESKHMGSEQERIEKINRHQAYVKQPSLNDLTDLGFQIRVEEKGRRQLVAWKIMS